MRKLFWVLLCLLPSLAWAEPLTVNYTEPAAQAGALASTKIYWCIGSSCTNFVLARKTDNTFAIQASDDGNGGDAKSIDISIPLNEADLPITVRIAVTSVNTSGNETDKTAVTATHTFSP